MLEQKCFFSQVMFYVILLPSKKHDIKRYNDRLLSPRVRHYLQIMESTCCNCIQSLRRVGIDLILSGLRSKPQLLDPNFFAFLPFVLLEKARYSRLFVNALSPDLVQVISSGQAMRPHETVVFVFTSSVTLPVRTYRTVLPGKYVAARKTRDALSSADSIWI